MSTTKPPSIELLLPVPVGTVGHSCAWLCGHCRAVHASKDLADGCVYCCCSYCKLPTDKPHQTYHDACADAMLAKVERDRFEKAEKLTDHDGWVYCDGIAHNNGYFPSLAELIADLEDDEIDPKEWPEYAWTCAAIPFQTPCVDTIIENITSDMFEDAVEHINGREELKAALAAFGEANKSLITYTPDYRRAVLIPRPA